MIVVGHHSLECPVSSTTHERRYRDSYSGRYDGVHMYGYTGSKDYTDSVNSILMIAFSHEITEQPRPRAELGSWRDDHTMCEQAQYQKWRQVQRRSNRNRVSTTQYRYGQSYNHGAQYIPTHNRFNILNQGNY